MKILVSTYRDDSYSGDRRDDYECQIHVQKIQTGIISRKKERAWPKDGKEEQGQRPRGLKRGCFVRRGTEC